MDQRYSYTTCEHNWAYKLKSCSLRYNHYNEV